MRSKNVIHSYLLKLITTTLAGTPLFIFAHGSMETPLSRVYNCFLEDPENPKSEACKAVVNTGSGTEALYNWNGINQLFANGNHRRVIPDGTLCSGNNFTFSALDILRKDWVATTISSNRFGKYDFVYFATTPHATRYFEFYITKDNYNPLLPLKWSDLEETPFCVIKYPTPVDRKYNLSCPFPKAKKVNTLYIIFGNVQIVLKHFTHVLM